MDPFRAQIYPLLKMGIINYNHAIALEGLARETRQLASCLPCILCRKRIKHKTYCVPSQVDFPKRAFPDSTAQVPYEPIAVGKLVKTHLESSSGCGFVEVECPNKCKDDLFGKYTVLTMKRKELDKHLTHVCYLRPYQCEFCGHKDTFEAITGESGYRCLHIRQVNVYSGHQAECPEIPLTCLNWCGSKDIKRKDMDSHRSKCPREPVQCPFVDAGCLSKMRHCELEDHMSVTSVMQQHLMMVMEDCKVTKSRLGIAEAKIYETEASLIKTKDKLCETEAKLSETEARLHESELELKKVNFKLSISEDRRYVWLNKLIKKGDWVRVQMLNYSEYCRSGEVWHSPPFYYSEGYKMRLDVCANGVGDGADTHVSMSLLLLRGERDSQVRWPLKCCDRSLHRMPIPRDGYASFFIGGPHERPAVYEYKLDHCDKFCPKRALNNCLIFDVNFFRGCLIDVCIVHD